MGNKIEKVIIAELDCYGISLNEFEMRTSKKEYMGKNRLLIIANNKPLAYIQIFDDGDIEFYKYDK